MTTIEEEIKEQARVQIHIRQAWDKILSDLKIDRGHTYALSNKPDQAQRLGNLVYDYLAASIFGTGWEGHTPDDLVGIKALLEDMSEMAELYIWPE